LTQVERLRTARRLTQNELAIAAGVSVNTIWRMEMSSSERKGGISIETACLVARALKVEVSDVFPNTELNYVQGRPAQTGGQRTAKAHPKTMYCPKCKTTASSMAIEIGLSECCETELVA
jgi:transcriptional regulator with XRE-family HTH domain